MIRDIIRFCVSLSLIAASAAFGSDGKTNVFFVHGANAVSAAYNPFVDGAMAEIKVFVVDAAGTPVKDATVSVVFLTDVQKVNVVKGRTDDAGCFIAKENCIGEIRLWVRKDGYYDTKKNSIKDFRRLEIDNVIKERSWAKAPVELRVLLKKILSPVRLVSRAVDFKPFPAVNEVLKLDLELLDWCPPYGCGKHDDLHLLYDGKINTDGRGSFYANLDVSFPNCVDGFYALPTDVASDFKYAYNADTNQRYQSEIKLRHNYTYGKGVTESKKIDDGEYLIYRVRSQTNEFGRVTHAHYGRIDEKFSQVLGLSIRSAFNPTDNDTNLEGN